jgi:hypothetical protein
VRSCAGAEQRHLLRKGERFFAECRATLLNAAPDAEPTLALHYARALFTRVGGFRPPHNTRASATCQAAPMSLRPRARADPGGRLAVVLRAARPVGEPGSVLGMFSTTRELQDDIEKLVSSSERVTDFRIITPTRSYRVVLTQRPRSLGLSVSSTKPSDSLNEDFELPMTQDNAKAAPLARHVASTIASWVKEQEPLSPGSNFPVHIFF